MDKNGGLSWKRAGILAGILFFLYWITSFVFEHGTNTYLNHWYILLVIFATFLCTLGFFLQELEDANDRKEIKQKKIINYFMYAMVAFFTLLICENFGLLNISITKSNLSFVFFEIPKTYIYDLFAIIIFPMTVTYIIRSVENSELSSAKAKTAFLQIVVVTLLEVVLFSQIDIFWTLNLAVFNIITVAVVLKNSLFGMNMKRGDRLAVEVVYIALWVGLIFICSTKDSLILSEYYIGNDWKQYAKIVREIASHASFFGPSQILIKTIEVRTFMGMCQENLIIWLLFYGGWAAVIAYILANISMVYILYKALSVELKRINKLYAVYLMAFLNIAIRVVAGLLSCFGILPIPVHLPFATMFGLVTDTVCVTLLICIGMWSRWMYGDFYEFEDFEEFDEFDEEILETEEEMDEDEFLEQLWKEANERHDLKNSKLLIGIARFLMVVFALGTWCVTLNLADQRIPGLKEYEIVDYLNEQNFYDTDEFIQL